MCTLPVPLGVVGTPLPAPGLSQPPGAPDQLPLQPVDAALKDGDVRACRAQFEAPELAYHPALSPSAEEHARQSYQDRREAEGNFETDLHRLEGYPHPGGEELALKLK